MYARKMPSMAFDGRLRQSLLLLQEGSASFDMAQKCLAGVEQLTMRQGLSLLLRKRWGWVVEK